MKKVFLFLAGCSLMIACNNKPVETVSAKTDSAATAATESKPTPQSEFADPKYTEIGKAMTEQLSKGDVDAWANNYSDDAKYRWSSGDSLSGKAAILDYWKSRRTKVIDSISFNSQVWLPIKVNKPQAGPDLPGIWLLSWYMVNVKYKNGQKLIFWVHTDSHFNASDKIDQSIQYIDRAPINAALAKK
ncbi:MAG: nuclear transport factor 2 family protein [Bacteroidota bacterium]